MNVKIDTKEKFTVITPFGPEISANMTENFGQMLLGYLSKPVPHLILNMKEIAGIEEKVAGIIATTQQTFYENGSSFVICEMQQPVEDFFDSLDLLEVLNATPTESEAWDIVQMEEIERELLNDNEE